MRVSGTMARQYGRCLHTAPQEAQLAGSRRGEETAGMRRTLDERRCPNEHLASGGEHVESAHRGGLRDSSAQHPPRANVQPRVFTAEGRRGRRACTFVRARTRRRSSGRPTRLRPPGPGGGSAQFPWRKGGNPRRRMQQGAFPPAPRRRQTAGPAAAARGSRAFCPPPALCKTPPPQSLEPIASRRTTARPARRLVGAKSGQISFS